MDELAQAPLRRVTPALVALICAALSKVNLDFPISICKSLKALNIVPAFKSAYSNGIVEFTRSAVNIFSF